MSSLFSYIEIFFLRITVMACFFLCVLSYGASDCVAQDQNVLSLDSAVLFALHESLDTKIATEQAKQAQYSLDEAKAEYAPEIRFTGSIAKEYNSPATFEEDGAVFNAGFATTNTYDVGVTLRQVLFDKTKTREVLARKKRLQASNFEVDIVEADLIEEVVFAYIDVLKAQKDLKFSKTAFHGIEKLVQKVEVAFEAGGESKAKLDFAQARLSLAESNYNNAESSFHNAKTTLEALTGPLPDFVAQEPEGLRINDHDLDYYEDLAAKENGELKVIQSGIEAAQSDFQKQRANYLPTVNLVADASQTNDKGGDVGKVRAASIGIEVDYLLFSGFQREAQKNSAASRVRQLELEKEDLIKDITAEIKLNYQDIQATYQEIVTKFQEVKSYYSLRKIADKSLEEGELDLFQSIENEENIYEAVTEIYNLKSEIYKSSYSLLKLISSLKKQSFCGSC